jgi:hypothetical protein
MYGVGLHSTVYASKMDARSNCRLNRPRCCLLSNGTRAPNYTRSYAAASLITTFTITRTGQEHRSKPNGIDWRTGYVSSYNVTLSFLPATAALIHVLPFRASGWYMLCPSFRSSQENCTSDFSILHVCGAMISACLRPLVSDDLCHHAILGIPYHRR